MAKLSACKDPVLFLQTMPKKEPAFRRYCGLDLATSTGVAYVDIPTAKTPDELFVFVGQWDLSVGQYDTGVLRFVRLKQFLEVLSPDFVALEDVKYTPPADVVQARKLGISGIIARVATASELIGGLKLTATMWAAERDVPCVGYSITQIKHAMTGSGRANKVDMIHACNRVLGTDLPADNYQATGADNMADAVGALLLGLREYGQGLPVPICGVTDALPRS